MNKDVFKHKKPDFNPPEGYFDIFEQQLMNRIHQEEKSRSFSIYHSWRAFTAAACISALILASGWNLQGIMKRTGIHATNPPPRELTLQVSDPENVILNDEELLEWIEQPVPVNTRYPDNSIHHETTAPAPLLTTDDLIEAGLIEPEDPALNLEGIF